MQSSVKHLQALQQLLDLNLCLRASPYHLTTTGADVFARRLVQPCDAGQEQREEEDAPAEEARGMAGFAGARLPLAMRAKRLSLTSVQSWQQQDAVAAFFELVFPAIFPCASVPQVPLELPAPSDTSAGSPRPRCVRARASWHAVLPGTRRRKEAELHTNAIPSPASLAHHVCKRTTLVRQLPLSGNASGVLDLRVLQSSALVTSPYRRPHHPAHTAPFCSGSGR